MSEKKHIFRDYVKRVLDLVISFFLLILLSPLLLILSLLVLIVEGHPIFFSQIRVGKNHRLFPIIKFRSMTNKRGADGTLLSDAERITKFGIFLRNTSLDELPALWNVMKGEMSLVGPRPLLPSYLGRYTSEQDRRHEVRPGITGWAQINGRNSISWEEKFIFDVWYVDHYSIRLDIMILFSTISYVVARKNISSVNSVSAEEFIGKKRE